MYFKIPVAYVVATVLLLGGCGDNDDTNQPIPSDASPDRGSAIDLGAPDLPARQDSASAADLAVDALTVDAPVVLDQTSGEVLTPDVAMDRGRVEVEPAQDLAATDVARLDGSGDCPDGQVLVTSQYGEFQPFCGQPCAITSDCPSGSACVVGMFDNPVNPVCVSAATTSTSSFCCYDGPTATCHDSRTLGTFIVIDQLHDGGWPGRIEGFSLTDCPNGCEKNPDGGVWPARCRSHD